MKKRQASEAISKVAQMHQVSVDTVRNDMREAISAAVHSPDPEVRFLWAQIPCAGEIPEPEELIQWLVKQL